MSGPGRRQSVLLDGSKDDNEEEEESVGGQRPPGPCAALGCACIGSGGLELAQVSQQSLGDSGQDDGNVDGVDPHPPEAPARPLVHPMGQRCNNFSPEEASLGMAVRGRPRSAAANPRSVGTGAIKDKRTVGALFEAARAGDFNKLVDTVEYSRFPHARNESKQTLIMVVAATLSADLAIGCIDFLLDARVNINAIDAQGRTAVHLACYNSDVDVLGHLLESQASVNEATPTGMTPLMLASKERLLKHVKRLVKSAAYINSQDKSGKSALLHVCTSDDYIRVSRVLCELHANLALRCNEGLDPVMMAAQHGSIGILEEFLERSAEVDGRNNDGDTPLILSIIYGHRQAALLVINAGCDVRLADAQGETPADLATRCHMDGLKALLILAREDENVNDQKDGSSKEHGEKEQARKSVDVSADDGGAEEDWKQMFKNAW